MCPGIANSSETMYIRTFVYHAQQNGFRVAVLNHFGALAGVTLTAPRLYTYGELRVNSNLSHLFNVGREARQTDFFASRLIPACLADINSRYFTG